MKLLDEFGQPAIRRNWDTILHQGRLPHAIMLYGEPGYGILPGALSLANDILCSQPVNGKACRICPSCNRAQKNIHPDLHFLLPLAGSKSISTDFLEPWRSAIAKNPWLSIFQWTQYAEVEGKQVDIHKEDIQRVASELCMQPYEGGNKVLIIWMAQFLTKEGNRLLKLIEEPPQDTYFIILTSQREQILPTIRSRCMQIFFPPVEDSQIMQLLHHVYGIEQTTAQRISTQADNDMDKALALTENTMFDFKEELTVWFRLMLSRKGNEIAQWATRMGTQEKEEQKQFALYALSSIRNILKGNTSVRNESRLSKEMVQYLNDQFDPEVWNPVLQHIQSGHEKISRNANAKLLWLSMSIGIKNQLAMYRLQHINT
jgi:DNA polymerase-3 subunit delta'